MYRDAQYVRMVMKMSNSKSTEDIFRIPDPSERIKRPLHDHEINVLNGINALIHVASSISHEFSHCLSYSGGGVFHIAWSLDRNVTKLHELIDYIKAEADDVEKLLKDGDEIVSRN